MPLPIYCPWCGKEATYSMFPLSEKRSEYHYIVCDCQGEKRVAVAHDLWSFNDERTELGG